MPGVLVVDDHSVTRSTIRSLLKGHSLPVCGEAENGKEAVEKVKELSPEVVLLDIEMPVMNGIQAAYEIRRISPSTKILFFTIHKEDAASGIRLLGAEGFVTKSSLGTDLIPILKRLVQAEYSLYTCEKFPYNRSPNADECRAIHLRRRR